jgi:hypothetical protein
VKIQDERHALRCALWREMKGEAYRCGCYSRRYCYIRSEAKTSPPVSNRPYFGNAKQHKSSSQTCNGLAMEPTATRVYTSQSPAITRKLALSADLRADHPLQRADMRGRRAQQSPFKTKECAHCTHVEADIAVPAPSPPSARGHVWMPNALFSICTCTYLRD